MAAELTDTERLIEAGILEQSDTYTYELEGRADPFKPFISKQVVATGPDPNEIIDENTGLSGMQLFEPGQLNLVGVMLSPQGELAFVEDQARKGYVIKVGTLIGKRGIVTNITPDAVLIEETARTRSGKEITSTVAMRLNKEGDR
ncbi:pilus assembly protein PilP [Desulfobulbus rhabdoformis]|uniref:pilus assembly protein PilP n=1 Tax=Desulfobulbus rhabdoformis TaxID=34032 RepID=UPI0019628EAC|nr:pilus assembly protein PilP [Desulfobulbus rhabdoformis]MBM9613187.1 pilus assembly protein PilP [Desulfobulbus rhabdoformis]